MATVGGLFSNFHLQFDMTKVRENGKDLEPYKTIGNMEIFVFSAADFPKHPTTKFTARNRCTPSPKPRVLWTFEHWAISPHPNTRQLNQMPMTACCSCSGLLAFWVSIAWLKPEDLTWPIWFMFVLAGELVSSSLHCRFMLEFMNKH